MSSPLILVVDDDRQWASIMQEALSGLYTVEVVHSQDAANRYIRDHHQKIAAAVVDICLEGMSISDNQRGLEILHLLAEYGIPSIATSAYACTPEAKVVLDALATARAQWFWFKAHANAVDLQDKVQEILRRSQPRPLSPWAKVAVWTAVMLLLLGFGVAIWRILGGAPGYFWVTSGSLVLSLLLFLFVNLREGLNAEEFREVLKPLLGGWFGHSQKGNG